MSAPAVIIGVDVTQRGYDVAGGRPRMSPNELDQALQALYAADPWSLPEDGRETLLEALGSADPAHRELALELAAELSGEMMDDAVAGRILTLVAEDPTEALRARAAITLGPILEECDLGDFDDALDAPPLSEEGFRALSSRLHALFQDTASPKEVRRRTLEASVRSPQSWQRDAVLAALRSEDLEWQTTAVFCMGFLGDFDSEILAALDAEPPEVRREAAFAAGRQSLEAAGERLYHLAMGVEENGDDELRLAAITALGTVPAAGGRELLEELADSENSDIASVAQQALDELEIWSAAEGLASALDYDP